jgi:hypothetical protein
MPCSGRRSRHFSRNVRILRCSCDWRCVESGRTFANRAFNPFRVGSCVELYAIDIEPLRGSNHLSFAVNQPRYPDSAEGSWFMRNRFVALAVRNLTAKYERVAPGTQRDFRSGKRLEYGLILLQPRSLCAPCETIAPLAVRNLTAKYARVGPGTQRDFRSGKRPEYGQILLQPRSLCAHCETIAPLAVRNLTAKYARMAPGRQRNSGNNPDCSARIRRNKKTDARSAGFRLYVPGWRVPLRGRCP